MKKLFFGALFCAFGLAAMAQTDQVLLTIDGKPVMASEFMYIYQKNNQEAAVDTKTIDEYLDMFINFKLKVFEAEAAGLDTTEAFAKELKGYRAQAIPKYMQDQEALDSLVVMSYNRMTKDRRAAHLAIECPMDASDSLQNAVLKQIDNACKRIKKEGFDKVVSEVSTIPTAIEDKGELGWIKPFRYVYAFEDAVYNTPVGSLSKPFRTPYGYHVALVEEEVNHLDVEAAHIMKMVPGDDAEVEAKAKAAIDSIYEVLMNGADFAAVATQESDDKGSAMRGGELGWFGRGVMVKPFEDMVYSLQSGEISKPFRSRFGWHIAKVSGFRETLPLDSIRDQVEKSVKRDERSKEADKSFVQKARIEYNLGTEMTDAEVRDYVDQHLEEKYEDLRHLVQEYHDGILLFDISLDRVWNKAAKDEEGLATYFAAHKADYTWNAPKWKGFVIYAQDQEHAKAAKAIVQSANRDSVQSYINSRVNNDSVQYVSVEYGLWARGKNVAVDQYGFKAKDVKYSNDKKPVVVLVGKLQKQPKEYQDERGKVTSDYQDELEKVWVEELRKKYTIEVNKEVFDSLR